MIDGVGSLLFVSPTRTFVNNSLDLVGFSRAGSSGLDLFNGPTASVFASWDMLTSIGPISGSGRLLQWASSPVVTTMGILRFQDGFPGATFRAQVGDEEVVPEPTSLILFGGGLLLSGLLGRKRDRA
jgi:hypothetical protein